MNKPVGQRFQSVVGDLFPTKVLKYGVRKSQKQQLRLQIHIQVVQGGKLGKPVGQRFQSVVGDLCGVVSPPKVLKYRVRKSQKQ